MTSVSKPFADGEQSVPHLSPDEGWRTPRILPLVLIVVIALVMGLPALRGGFVSADDLRLVRDHVLVNHPSLNHAVKLFAVSHHDLYQPLPLLTFSAEFAVAYQFGLFERGGDADEGAWLFHLDNILLHAVNAVLDGSLAAWPLPLPSCLRPIRFRRKLWPGSTVG
jgi:hypothetical protein